MMLKGIANGVPKDITRIAMKGKNLAYDKIQSANINSSGKITTPQQGTDVSIAKIVIGKTYTVNSYVLAFYENEPAVGSVSYDNSRIVGTNGRPTIFTAPITGYVAFRVDGNNRETPMCNEGTTILPYEPYGMQQGWEVRDNQGTILWGADKTLTASAGSISYRGYGLPLKDVEVEGNMTQTGTPDPTTPIWPDETGEKTGNLFSGWTTGINLNSTTGVEYPYTEGAVSDYIAVDMQKDYTFSGVYDSYSSFVAAYNANHVFLGRTQGAPRSSVAVDSASFIAGTPQGTGDIKYLRICVYKVSGQTGDINNVLSLHTMCNEGSTALPYEPYGYKIPLTCAGQTVPVYLGQTQTVRRIYKMRLENPTSSTETSNGYRLSFSISGHRAPPYTSGGGFCNITKWQGDYTKIGFVASNLNAFITQNIPEWATKEGATVWLEENEVYIWYILATPETGIVNEPIRKIGTYADTLTVTDQDVTITPAVGNDTLTIGTTLAPSALSITGHVKARSV